MFPTLNLAATLGAARPSRRTVRRLLGLLVAVLIMVTTAPPLPNAAASPLPVTPLRMGVAYGDELVWKSDPELAAALDSARDLGIDWIRVDLSWADIQYDGPRSYHWERFDRVMDAANERNLRVLAVLAYTPAWARKMGCETQSCSPRDTLEFARFATLAAERYAPRGLHYWEVWNEPNLPLFWSPTPDAAAYTRVLKTTTTALRAADPRARVLMGGLAAAWPGGPAIDQVQFLADVTRYGGTQVVDAVAFHPYTFPLLPSWKSQEANGWRTSWDTIHGNLRLPKDQYYSLRQVLDDHKMWSTPIWITEYGAPTGGPGLMNNGSPLGLGETSTHVTELWQAAMAGDAVSMVMADPTVGSLIWYSEKDRSTDPHDTENFFGLRRADGTRKPAWYVLRDTLGQQRQERPRW